MILKKIFAFLISAFALLGSSFDIINNQNQFVFESAEASYVSNINMVPYENYFINYNQLLLNGSFKYSVSPNYRYNASFVSFTANNDYTTINYLVKNSLGYQYTLVMVPGDNTIINSHKYLCSYDIKTNKNINFGFDVFNSGVVNDSYCLADTWTNVHGIYQYVGGSSGLYYCNPRDVVGDLTCFVKNCMLVDLTDIYGVGNEPSSYEAFISDFPIYNNYVSYGYYSLDIENIKDDGFDNGVESVVDDPGIYNLYTESEYNNSPIAFDKGYNSWISPSISNSLVFDMNRVQSYLGYEVLWRYYIDNNIYYEVYSEQDSNINYIVTAYIDNLNDIETEVSRHQYFKASDVTNDVIPTFTIFNDLDINKIPNNFNWSNSPLVLVSNEISLDRAREEGFQSGVNSILNNPNDYDLFNQSQVADNFNEGYLLGSENGYSEGFNDGIEEGLSQVNGTSNVFSLYSNVFSSVASVLSIQVAPGLSLGLILFAPILIIIIIALFKLIGG